MSLTPTIATLAGGHELRYHDDFKMLSSYPNSSSVYRWSYDTEFQKLLVTFQSNKDKTYLYDDVTTDTLVRLIVAPSVGSFIATVIKPNHTVTAL
jgi:hypothetical protein